MCYAIGDGDLFAIPSDDAAGLRVAGSHGELDGCLAYEVGHEVTCSLEVEGKHGAAVITAHGFVVVEPEFHTGSARALAEWTVKSEMSLSGFSASMLSITLTAAFREKSVGSSMS